MKHIHIDSIQKVADLVRLRVFWYTIANRGGYLSQACSSAELFASLYMEILKLEALSEPIMPFDFTGVPSKNNLNYRTGSYYNGKKSKEYDRFFLSPAQYALILYAVLIEVKRMHKEALISFNKDNSTLEMIGAEHSPGMEVMTGSLGQGMSQASGVAMARKLKKDSGRVVVLLSDGECQSGQFWETLQGICFHGLGNMQMHIDMNGCQCDGSTKSVMSMEHFASRLIAFGAHVLEVDGHNILSTVKAASREHMKDDRPTFILSYTDPTRGIEILKERASKLHYVRLNQQDEYMRYVDAFNQMRLLNGDFVGEGDIRC